MSCADVDVCAERQLWKRAKRRKEEGVLANLAPSEVAGSRARPWPLDSSQSACQVLCFRTSHIQPPTTSHSLASLKSQQRHFSEFTFNRRPPFHSYQPPNLHLPSHTQLLNHYGSKTSLPSQPLLFHDSLLLIALSCQPCSVFKAIFYAAVLACAAVAAKEKKRTMQRSVRGVWCRRANTALYFMRGRRWHMNGPLVPSRPATLAVARQDKVSG